MQRKCEFEVPNIKYIKDISAAEISVYRDLKTRSRSMNDHRVFIAETHTVIKNAIACGCVPISFLVAEKYIFNRDKQLLDMFPEATIYTAADDVLEQLTGYPLTRGILSAMTYSFNYTEQDLLRKYSRIAILENVQDASNVGAIIRSACGLGIDAVILDSASCDPLHRKAIRASMGAVFKIPWLHSRKTGLELAELFKENEYLTMAFALSSKAIPLQKAFCKCPSLRLGLFLGSEGKGLNPETINACDETVIIPMSHSLDSINVAAAAAIIFWESGKMQEN